jgi:phosphatidylinositol-3,4,5-trisphosphate 3-phosphatase/dual-specificity protein phosphatase PTEN
VECLVVVVISFTLFLLFLDPFFTILCGEKELQSKSQFKIKTYKQSQAFIEWAGIEDAIVEGDVLVEVLHKPMIGKKEKIFQLWFNTSFLEASGLFMVEKFMLDKACKDKLNKKLSQDLRFEIQYEFVDQNKKNRDSKSKLTLEKNSQLLNFDI